MPKPTDKQRVRAWQTRVDAADKVFEKWERRFKCKQLEKFYLGEQWEGETNQDKYVINLIFPTIETRKPALVYYRPVFKVDPKPPLIDDPGSTVEERTKIRQDTLNTFISEPDVHFQKLVQLCIHEAHFYFGVIEVGYSADFMENPNAGKPVLNDSDEPMRDEKNETIAQPAQLVQSEQVYVRRIPAKRFRVSVRAGNLLRDCDWIGYFEEVLLEDIKKNPRYRNISGLEPTGFIKGEKVEDDGDDPKSGTVKLWKVWDQRSKRRFVWVDSKEKFLLEEPYDFLPFVEPLKFREILDEFYPLPEVYNWLPVQKELNETREMQRIHRKRFVRRYLVSPNSNDEEIENLLKSTEDGSYAHGKDGQIVPVPDAALDPAIVRNIPQSKDDFREISGVTGEQRGVSEAETATQAQIMNVRSQIRESSGRQEVGEWLGNIGTLILRTIEHYRALDFWIVRNVDMAGLDPASEVARIVDAWQKVNVADFGQLHYEVSCDVSQLSPVAQEKELENWNRFLSLLSNQSLLIILTASDLVLQKTANLYGIRSAREIQEFKKLGQIAMMLMAQQAQMTAGGGGGASSSSAPSSPGPSQGSVDKQLQGQMGFTGPLG